MRSRDGTIDEYGIIINVRDRNYSLKKLKIHVMYLEIKDKLSSIKKPA